MTNYETRSIETSDLGARLSHYDAYVEAMRRKEALYANKTAWLPKNVGKTNAEFDRLTRVIRAHYAQGG